MNKEAEKPLSYAGTGPAYSYLSTLNPISGVTGGGDRFPEWIARMFPGNPQAAHMTFKLGALGLLTAGVVGSARMIKHFNNMADLAEKDNPAGKLHSQLSTTFEVPMSPGDAHKGSEKDKTVNKAKQWIRQRVGQVVDTAKSDVSAVTGLFTGKTAAINVIEDPNRGIEYTPKSLSMGNAISMAAPLGVMLLAAGAGYKLADNIAGARRNRLLDEAIKRKADATKALMKTRARIPKGLATEKDIKNTHDIISSDDIFLKQGSTPLTQKVVSAAGLLGIAMMSATALGSYKYFSASNPNNIKYKALKKGLSEYAKQRTNLAPISVIPTDSDAFFKEIDGPAATAAPKATPRSLPQFDPSTLNNPISVSL
jgi:hypothetical protein